MSFFFKKKIIHYKATNDLSGYVAECCKVFIDDSLGQDMNWEGRRDRRIDRAKFPIKNLVLKKFIFGIKVTLFKHAVFVF